MPSIFFLYFNLNSSLAKIYHNIIVRIVFYLNVALFALCVYLDINAFQRVDFHIAGIFTNIIIYSIHPYTYANNNQDKHYQRDDLLLFHTIKPFIQFLFV